MFENPEIEQASLPFRIALAWYRHLASERANEEKLGEWQERLLTSSRELYARVYAAAYNQRLLKGDSQCALQLLRDAQESMPEKSDAREYVRSRVSLLESMAERSEHRIFTVTASMVPLPSL